MISLRCPPSWWRYTFGSDGDTDYIIRTALVYLPSDESMAAYPTKNVHRAAHHALAVEVACTMSSMYCVWVGGVLGGAGWRFFTQLRLTCQNLRVRANDRAACLRAPLTPLTHTTHMAGRNPLPDLTGAQVVYDLKTGGLRRRKARSHARVAGTLTAYSSSHHQDTGP